jgi:hypothetical protein
MRSVPPEIEERQRSFLIRTGREQRSQATEVVAPARLEPGLLYRVDEFGRGAENVEADLIADVEQPIAVGIKRRAVV